MNPIKVLGLGSPFGDDQLGWCVIATLKNLVDRSLNHIILEQVDRPGVRLIEMIRGFDTVIIIDAVKSGNPLGTIHRFEKNNILESDNQFSTHGLSILDSLQLAHALGELPKNILFYGIEIDQITLDSTLSQPIKKVISELANQLKNELGAVDNSLA